MRRLLLRYNIKCNENEPVNVLQALQDIVRSYQDANDGTLHPRALRKGLNELYCSEQLFAEGTMCDAEDTLVRATERQEYLP